MKEFVLAPVLAAQGVSANVELRNIHYFLKLYHTANERCLPPEQFDQFILEKFDSKVKSPLMDSWGEKYHYDLTYDGFVVWSSGPDRLSGTPDDIVFTWKER